MQFKQSLLLLASFLLLPSAFCCLLPPAIAADNGSTPSQPQKQRVLKLGMYHSPPYYHTEDVKKPTGLSLDILTPVATALGYRLEVVPCPFPRCLKMAAQGELDLVAGLINNQEREKFLYFLSPPMMQFHSAFVFYSRPQAPFKLTQLADLKGRTVAVMRDAVYFPDFDNSQIFTRVKVPSESVALDMVAMGRVDYAITVEKTALGSFHDAGLQLTDLQRQPYFQQQKIDGYLAFSRLSPNFAIAPQLEAELQLQARQGLLDKLWVKYGLSHP